MQVSAIMCWQENANFSRKKTTSMRSVIFDLRYAHVSCEKIHVAWCTDEAIQQMISLQSYEFESLEVLMQNIRPRDIVTKQ